MTGAHVSQFSGKVRQTGAVVRVSAATVVTLALLLASGMSTPLTPFNNQTISLLATAADPTDLLKTGSTSVLYAYDEANRKL